MSRRLVVCADGTWNAPDEEDEGKLAPTNVVKLYEAVRRKPVAGDGTLQMSYYHEGIGVKPNLFEQGLDHLAALFHIHGVNRNLFQGITGDGIDQNIKDCYGWLVRNFVPGDEIYLFGFSRGAYTVRSLAGFIRKCGILKQADDSLTDAGFELYRQRDDPGGADSPDAVAFRKANSIETDIKCIGVWETVGSLGIPIDLPILSKLDKERYQFHDVSLSTHVRYAYHALGIDERRKAFSPTLWEQQAGAGDQVLEQNWFAGSHSNIGGGYADSGLSDTTFLWLADRVTKVGLELDDAYVKSVVNAASWNGVLRDSAVPAGIWEIAVRAIADGRSQADGASPDTRHEAVDPAAARRYEQIVPPDTTPWEPSNLADYYHRFPRPA
jgi:uncharacterized protein (DUF2235 family)